MQQCRRKSIAWPKVEAPQKKSVTAVAKEVLAGKWGNGDARKKKRRRLVTTTMQFRRKSTDS